MIIIIIAATIIIIITEARIFGGCELGFIFSRSWTYRSGSSYFFVVEGNLHKWLFFQEKVAVFLKSQYRTRIWGGAAILLVMR